MDFLRLLRGEPVPDHSTFARFRTGRTKDAVEDLFYQFVRRLEELGETEHDEVFIDGTRIESRANRYTFVWRKTMERYLGKVREAVRQEFERRGISDHVTLKKLRRLVRKEKAAVLNGLRNRGVEDIFIACTDNLAGFSGTIEAVFPKAEIRNCVIRQIRNSTKYVSYKDLKAVYAAVDESSALDTLDVFSGHWDKKYPKISASWRENWPNLSTYFKFPQEVRRLIYTTNAIEGFNRQLRKVTKAKSVFPTDDSLLKMLYLAMMDITKKWTGRRQDWSMIHAQLAVFFAGRMPD